MDKMEANEFTEPAEGGPIDLQGNHPEEGRDLHALADTAAGSIAGEGDNGELEPLRQKVKELEESLRSEDDKYKRLLADFQNFRNRASKDIQMGIEQSEKRIMLEVLQVFDSFNRCMGSPYSSIEALRAGVELIRKQFYDTLRRLGVSEIEINLGDIFDAHIAEALTTIDTANFPEGSIVDVCEKGFNFGGRLLRPAKVVVARGNNPT
jgi:molecular chaperone GrpE